VIQLPEDRRPPISPSLALRIAVMGGIALVLFAVVFFRLWYLQVLSGDQYVSQANQNQVREVRIQAPRGEIVDRYGRQIVTNRIARVVQVELAKLPPAGAPRQRLYRRLGGGPADVAARDPADRHRAAPGAALRQRDGQAGRPAVGDELHQGAPVALPRRGGRAGLPAPLPLRRARRQLLGYVGRIQRDQLSEERYKGVNQQAVVGQAGLEWQYDRYLRGRDGASLLSINSLGRSRGFLRRREPVPGRNLKLSLDLGLQKAGQEAVARAGHGNPGGFVAMDPRDGQILALGSVPTFNPSVFAKPLSQSTFSALNSQANGAPLFNRAIAGAYPTGSTFKPVTALAGLSAGVIGTGTVINDTGCLTVGLTKFCSPGNQGHGAVALTRAIQVSSDVFFYTVGRDLDPIKGEPLQRWGAQARPGTQDRHRRARGGQGQRPRPGVARPPGPRRGTLPQEEEGADVRHLRHAAVVDGRQRQPVDRPGRPAGLAAADGDRLLGDRQRRQGRAAAPRPGGRRQRGPAHPGDRSARLAEGQDPSAFRDAIMSGLHAAASQAGGTSADVFTGWPQNRLPVFGKTGTAQRPNQQDQSWYVAYVPNRSRPIVVATTIERGGFGAEAAAPATCQILRKWFSVTNKAKCVGGQSKTL